MDDVYGPAQQDMICKISEKKRHQQIIAPCFYEKGKSSSHFAMTCITQRSEQHKSKMRAAGAEKSKKPYLLVETVNSVTLDITLLPCNTERQNVANPFFIFPDFTMAV